MSMKRGLLPLITPTGLVSGLLIFPFFIHAQPLARYITDLNSATEKSLEVCVIPSESLSYPATFAFPRMVPGTYSVYDFGRFADTLFVYKNGSAQPLPRTSLNHWTFTEKPDSFKYTVRPTWTDKDYTNFVFQPAGSNFEPGKNFVFNNHAIFGYFKGYENKPLETDIKLVPGFFPSTTVYFRKEGTQTTFRWKSYHELVDSPIMFNLPDTTTIRLGDTEILISIYNPSKRIKAAVLAETLSDLLTATRDFLGGKLPVKRYAFIFYIPDVMRSLAAGALEHNLSSFYYLPFMGEKATIDMIRDVAAHEFFHIITPLNLHAEQIHNFDYDNPEMSAHLWLYEGVTEYHAGLVQITRNLMTEADWKKWILDKIKSASAFNDTLPFTELSLGALDTHKEQYTNVYQKGALIGMCLDMVLISSTEGRVNLRSLLMQLSEKYGPEKPFRDEDLFAEIGTLGSPEAQDFMEKHVAGKSPLPLDSLLRIFGYQLVQNTSIQNPHAGFNASAMAYNRARQSWYLSSDSDIFPEGKKAGLKAGDEIIRIGETRIEGEKGQSLIDQRFTSLKPGEIIQVEIIRDAGTQKEKRKTLKVKAGFQEEFVKIQVLPLPNPDAITLRKRKAWINQ